MKTCRRCGVPKIEGDFSKNLLTKDSLGSWCRMCLSTYGKNKRSSLEGQTSRKNFVESNRNSIRQNAAVVRNERKKFISSLKAVPCMDCHLEYPSYCMDFDHARGEKHRQISNMVDFSQASIAIEVSKCDVVCANCHRVRTGSRIKQTASSKGYLKGRDKLNGLKAVLCMDCGFHFPPIAMDFDHVRGIKTQNVAFMKEAKWERVLEEVSKCDVVCTVCHRKRTVARKAKSPEVTRVVPIRTWHTLVGTMSDYALAKQAGVSKTTVLYYRRRNNIPAFGQAFGRKAA